MNIIMHGTDVVVTVNAIYLLFGGIIVFVWRALHAHLGGRRGS